MGKVMVTFCSPGWENEGSSRLLALLENRWKNKPISAFYSWGVYLARGRTGSDDLVSSLQAIAFYVFHTELDKNQHILFWTSAQLDWGVILVAWYLSLRSVKWSLLPFLSKGNDSVKFIKSSRNCQRGHIYTQHHCLLENRLWRILEKYWITIYLLLKMTWSQVGKWPGQSSFLIPLRVQKCVDGCHTLLYSGRCLLISYSISLLLAMFV